MPFESYHSPQASSVFCCIKQCRFENLCLPKWWNEVHSKSLTKSEENGPGTSIVIYNVLSSYQPKLDANTI